MLYEHVLQHRLDMWVTQSTTNDGSSYLNVKTFGWNIGSNWPMLCLKTWSCPCSRENPQKRVESQFSTSLTGLKSSLDKDVRLVAGISTLPTGLFLKFADLVIWTDLLATSPNEIFTLNTGMTSSCWASVCRKWTVSSDVSLEIGWLLRNYFYL